MTFYINTVTHEIHKSTCSYLPVTNRSTLGNFDYPSEAVSYAKRQGYNNADGCYYCCNQSHTK